MGRGEVRCGKGWARRREVDLHAGAALDHFVWIWPRERKQKGKGREMDSSVSLKDIQLYCKVEGVPFKDGEKAKKQNVLRS